jgi:hypothetical protein
MVQVMLTVKKLKMHQLTIKSIAIPFRKKGYICGVE